MRDLLESINKVSLVHKRRESTNQSVHLRFLNAHETAQVNKYQVYWQRFAIFITRALSKGICIFIWTSREMY